MPQAALNDLGPAALYWNDIFLGNIFGTVTWHDELTTAPIQEEQHGVTPVDLVTTGLLNTVEVPLTRLTIAQQTIINHGVTNPTVTSMLQKNKVGEALYPLSKGLVLKPLVNLVATVDEDKWMTFFKTYPVKNIDTVFDNAGQRINLVMFSILPVQTSGLTFADLWRQGPAT